MNKQTKILLLVPLLLCFLSVGYSSALPTICADYTIGATSGDSGANLNVAHPSAGATITASSAIYQSFKTEHNGTYLTQIDLYLKRVGAPNAIYRLALYDASGTYGVSNTPNTLIETSTTDLQISTLQTSYTLQSFTFAGTTQLIADTVYTLVYYEYSEVTCSTTANSAVMDDGAAVYGGNAGYYYLSGWNAFNAATYDICFQVWGEGGQEVVYLGGNTYYETVENQYTIDATAEFNNTQIAAEGGTVTAAETPINYYNSAAMILLSIICIALTVKPSVPILNFCFGIITFGIAAATAGQTDMLLYGYIQILCIIMSIICMLSGYNSWKR